MVVIDNAGTTVEFSVIKCAECFEYEGSVLMRVEEINCDNGLPINCVALFDGLLYHMKGNELVTPIEGNFAITHRGVKR